MAHRLCLFGLILAGMLVIQALGDKSEVSEPNPAGILKAQGVVNVNRIADRPVSSVAERSDEGKEEPEEAETEAEAPASRKMGKHHSDKSMAGGGVIIGGLVTAIFAAVFCYIRVTRKRNAQLPS
uniref:Uncharacterized protein n=1 Tax=Cannabis sativa TaxID=3483 RepID=A0A803RB83_CANSA